MIFSVINTIVCHWECSIDSVITSYPAFNWLLLYHRVTSELENREMLGITLIMRLDWREENASGMVYATVFVCLVILVLILFLFLEKFGFKMTLRKISWSQILGIGPSLDVYIMGSPDFDACGFLCCSKSQISPDWTVQELSSSWGTCFLDLMWWIGGQFCGFMNWLGMLSFDGRKKCTALDGLKKNQEVDV